MALGLRRRLLLVVAAAVFLSTAAGWAATQAATVKTLRSSELGTIVVNARGLTLYHMTSEKGGAIKCSGACAKQWPPLLLTGTAKPLAGPGIAAAKLGVVKRPDGTMQVTYNHAPLYRFAGDSKPGTANGEGIEGVWFALAPSGAIVKPKQASSTPSATTTTPATTTPSTSGGGGGGGDYGY